MRWVRSYMKNTNEHSNWYNVRNQIAHSNIYSFIYTQLHTFSKDKLHLRVFSQHFLKEPDRNWFTVTMVATKIIWCVSGFSAFQGFSLSLKVNFFSLPPNVFFCWSEYVSEAEQLPGCSSDSLLPLKVQNGITRQVVLMLANSMLFLLEFCNTKRHCFNISSYAVENFSKLLNALKLLKSNSFMWLFQYENFT